MDFGMPTAMHRFGTGRFHVVLTFTGIALTISVGLGQTQTETALRAKFEVASVKPCRDDIGPDARSGGGNSSPGRLNIECQTVMGLIRMAYVIFADGRHISRGHVPLSGGPAWINSDRYTIDAKPESTQSQEMMRGPMLQALLEDRFHLKVHRETREIPVYELTVARGGLKLKVFQRGSCVPIDFLNLQMSTLESLAPDVHYCRNSGDEDGGIVTYEAQGTSLDEFAKIVLGNLDRPVINKTGVAGLFNVHFQYAPERTDPAAGASGSAGPSIFTAVQQQLGLKLVPAKGSGEFLVIDSAERPSEN
jgi:uncharacterized protein (TIGR03435 family)